MAIQNRRGIFDRFDPTKMLPGEFAVVVSGDPDTVDGRSVYICFSAGTTKRLATWEDMAGDLANAFEELEAEFSSDMTAATNAATSAAQAATSSKNAADVATQSATEAAADAHPTTVGRRRRATAGRPGKARTDRSPAAADARSTATGMVLFRRKALVFSFLRRRNMRKSAEQPFWRRLSAMA